MGTVVVRCCMHVTWNDCKWRRSLLVFLELVLPHFVPSNKVFWTLLLKNENIAEISHIRGAMKAFIKISEVCFNTRANIKRHNRQG